MINNSFVVFVGCTIAICVRYNSVMLTTRYSAFDAFIMVA